MQNAKNTPVSTTQNNAVKHAKFISVAQAQAQNKANAVLYTSAQLEQLTALAQKAQAQYYNKNVYKNLRKKFCVVKISNTTSVCSNLIIIAKQFNAKVVITKTSILLRLFA